MTINITARRHSNGNTYHRVEIREAGTNVSHFSDITYGGGLYGAQWERTALEMLCALYGGPSDRGLWHWQNETGHKIVEKVVDVKRRRGLYRR